MASYMLLSATSNSNTHWQDNMLLCEQGPHREFEAPYGQQWVVTTNVLERYLLQIAVPEVDRHDFDVFYPAPP